MKVPSPLEATVAVLVVIIGLLIGGILAITQRASQQSVPTAPVAGVPVATPARMPQPTAAATLAPTAPPAAAPPSPLTPASSPTSAVASRSGSWRIQEANVQVGTIVWSGAATASGRNALVLDVHKESVLGRPVSPCEHETTLHVAVTPSASPQTVPYREVNCSGATSGGEMRISTFSGDGRSFSGSFWRDGSKLGDFTAVRS